MTRMLCVLAASFLAALSCGGPGGSSGLSILPVDYMDLPCDLDSLMPLDQASVRLSIGEYEPLALLLSARDAVEGARVRFSSLPDGVKATLYRVTEHRRRVRGGETVTPYFLEEAESVEMAAGARQVHYIVFKADPGTAPGKTDLQLNVAGTRIKVALEVYPFSLRDDPDYFFGAFCGARDVDIAPAHLADLKARGFDALQFFWGSVAVRLSNENGKLAVDFSRVDRWMEDFKAAGMRGPVVWSMGNDYRSHMENVLAGLFDLPKAEPRAVDGKTTDFADITNPRLNELVKELMTAIRDHSRERAWPEIVFIIYDEPTERLMDEHEDRYRFLKSFWPELRIYGVTMNRIQWARDIAHMTDIFVANGDFAEISALADSLGKSFWLYGSGSSRDAASLRHSYAWTPWKTSARASWFWAYNYSSGDPYDDFDGGLAETSASMVWPPRDPGGPLVFSVSWEGMRETADDMRYLRTLEWMLERSEHPRAAEITAELAQMKDDVPSGRTVRVEGGDAHDRVQVVSSRKYVEIFRRKVAGWIVEMLEVEPARYRGLRPGQN